MNPFSKIVVLTALLSAASVVLADSEKDCLLQGTVVHGEQTGQSMTTVKINSISKYDEDARCNMRRGQKMEFKLPEDARLKDAPSGSGVKYRYRTYDDDQPRAELISIGA